jgi:ribosomal-protein-alanine N-acetyltransferase
MNRRNSHPLNRTPGERTGPTGGPEFREVPVARVPSRGARWFFQRAASLSGGGHTQAPNPEDQSRSLPAGAPRIERAAASDLQALASLEQQCFDAGVAISRRQFRYLLSRPTAEVWVWREQGRVVADAVVLRRRTPRGVLGRLYSLVVAPDQRGRGVGRALLQVCLDRLGRQRAYAVVLEVRTDNRPALALYRAEGFQAVRRINGYYAGGRSAIRMFWHSGQDWSFRWTFTSSAARPTCTVS